MTTAATKLTGLIGHPVSHSLSPAIHTAAITAAELDAVYLAFDIAPAQVEVALNGLFAAGAWGLNATIPHKAAAFAFADARTQEAEGVGVANTLFWQDGRLWADNTDATGLMRVFADLDLHPGDWVEIVGAGGAARAAAVAAGRAGLPVTCVARRRDQGRIIERLARTMGAPAPTMAGVPRMVINATPLGRHGENLDARHMHLGPGRIALDLNYEGSSNFLKTTRASGGQAVDGKGMLVAQAEAAFSRWFGQWPPNGSMRSALGQN